jgi:hypothetical protein
MFRRLWTRLAEEFGIEMIAPTVGIVFPCLFGHSFQGSTTAFDLSLGFHGVAILEI